MIATIMMVMVVVMMVIMASLDVRDDMERGLLLSRGSVPTGGRCCGRLDIVRIIVVIIVGFFFIIMILIFSLTCCTNPRQGWTGRRWRLESQGKEANPAPRDQDKKLSCGKYENDGFDVFEK